MRTIIAGSRKLSDIRLVERAVQESGFEVTVVLSGRATRGIDRLGEQWAAQQGVPVEPHPANWDTYGLEAGFVRNREMVAVAEALIAIWDGVSRGTAHCITEAKRRGLPVFVLQVSDAC